MNRPARLLVAVFIDWPARIADTALTLLVPSTPAHVIRAENQRLARRVVCLESQIDFLVDVLDDADHAAGTSRDEAMRHHPAGKGLPTDADLADLHSLHTYEDFLYVTREEA